MIALIKESVLLIPAVDAGLLKASEGSIRHFRVLSD